MTEGMHPDEFLPPGQGSVRADNLAKEITAFFETAEAHNLIAEGPPKGQEFFDGRPLYEQAPSPSEGRMLRLSKRAGEIAYKALFAVGAASWYMMPFPRRKK